MRRRKLLEKTYWSLYSRMEGVDLGECWYCGDHRQTLDHCPPISQLENIDLKVFLREGGRLLLVPCCDQCNILLGSKPLWTPEERLAYLWEAYIKKVDEGSAWTDDEAADLGPGLKPMVMARIAKTKVLVRKLRGVETKMLSCQK